MIVVCSSRGDIGIQAAWDILQAGGSALDAVEAGVRLVESNASDPTVGLGGLPNILGDVQVDASIMDGRTLRTGAVAAVRGCEHAITLARKVMEELPHVMLVGPGAERFAHEMGLPWRDLLTDESAAAWCERVRQVLGSEEVADIAAVADLRRAAWKAMELELAGGTVNYIAQDVRGDITCAISTSGWAWKYPGRVGDSPIIGAGGYADNRYGAAACVGMGELTIRTCAAHSAVWNMKAGMSSQEAGRQALLEVAALANSPGGMVDMIVLSADGTPAGLTTDPVGWPYWVWADGMNKPEKRLKEPVDNLTNDKAAE